MGVETNSYWFALGFIADNVCLHKIKGKQGINGEYFRYSCV